MALPTLSKTWVFNLNNAQAAQGSVLACNQAVMFALVNALIATGKWAVYYSCSSTVAGAAGDGVNRWASPANLVWNAAGTPHSWMVLRNTSLASGNYQLLLELGTDGVNFYLTAKKSNNAGFTGGSTTAVPTATDQINILVGNNWGQLSVNAAMRWSVEVSNDGQCTRVILASQGTARGFWLIEQLGSPEAGITYPTAEYIVGNSGGAATPTLGSWVCNPVVGVSSASSTIGYESQLTTLPSPSSFTGNWPMCQCALDGNVANMYGRLGLMQDLWIGTTSAASGDSYPGAPNWAANTVYAVGAQVTNGSNIYTCTTGGTSASSGGPTGTGSGIADNTCVWSFFSATMQFVHVGQYILPWNGGAFNLT